jgi:hypothetical protein
MTTTTKKNSRSTRVSLALLAITACLGIAACTATGHAEGEGTLDPPFVPPIKWKVSATLGEFEVDGGEERADKCVKVTWTDKDGAEISSETLETDGSGSASGQVPPGAVRWEAKVVDCPEPEPEEKSGSGTGGGGMFDPFQQSQRIAINKMRTFEIYGAPIVPSDDDGAMNLTYNFSVRARSWAHAEALIAPLVAGGIGTPVPPAVEVLSYSTMEAGVAGGRLICAMPGNFEDFTFDFNSGAFVADLNSSLNVINYQLGGWDVVELVIPMSAFDFGFSGGVTYSNNGTASYKTDRLLDYVGAGYRFEFSN